MSLIRCRAISLLFFALLLTAPVAELAGASLDYRDVLSEDFSQAACQTYSPAI